MEYPTSIIVDGGVVRYRLTDDFLFMGYTLPKGFISDGASVPRLFWSVFPPVGEYFGSALLHDYLLVNGYKWKDAADEFSRALKYENVAKIKRNVMLWFVRLYGFVYRKR